MEFVKNHQKTALIYEDKSISYEELIKYSIYYGSKLQIEENDKVLIFSPNRPELIYSYLGIWHKKATNIIVDYANTAIELAYVLADSKPKYIYTTIEAKSKVLEAISLGQCNPNVLYFEDNKVPEDYEPHDKIIEGLDKEKIALLLYTSGTTGQPKGVMLSFDNILSQVEALEKYNVYEKSDRFLCLLPMHHIFPLLGSTIVPLYFGSTLVFLKEISSDKIIEALKKYKITMMLGVPRLYELFHKGIMTKIKASKIASIIFFLAKNINSMKRRKKLFKKVQDGFGGHIKWFVSGGAKLDLDVSKDMYTLGFSMLEGYGLTETSPMISFTHPNQIQPGSCGHYIEGITVKFSEGGEILVKGRNVFKGYFNRPEETAATFDEDGFFKTGDLGSVDKEGFLTITGRLKEMIVLSNGKNINPMSIEKEVLALSNGLIEEIAVLEHDKILKAVILPNFNKVAELKIQNIQETIKWTIIDEYNSHAPKYRKILNIKLIKEELPKTKLGKLRRFMLSDFFNSEVEERKEIAKPSYEEYRILKDYLYSISQKNIYPDSHIELDLGFDSLDMVELNAFVEQNFGIKLNEENFSNNPTVEKLSLFLKNNGKKSNEFHIDWKEVLKTDEKYKLPVSSLGLIKLKILGKIIFNTYFRVKKAGLSNLPDGPFLLVSNHQSFLDAFILIMVLPIKHLRKTFFMAKEKHFENGFMKFLAHYSNTIIVDINQNLSRTLKESAFVLKNGKNMVIFPEGIRTRDGELNEFKKSFAILSKELGIPVVPFGIKGAYEALPFGKSFPKPKKIIVEFLKPIYPTDYTVEELVNQTRNTIDTWLKN